MERIELSDDDLVAQARQQIGLLQRACGSFDDGHMDEYLSISVRLRVLLHHNPKRGSHALLHRLGLHRESWWVASGGDVVDENYLPEHKLLLGGELGGTQTSWTPRFSEFGVAPKLPWRLQVHRLTHGMPNLRGGGWDRSFDDWWNQAVIRDAERHEFSRFDLIRVTSNQDGGAHADPSIDDVHYRLTRMNSIGMFKGKTPRDSPVPATVRQIAWEVHAMLTRHRGDLLPETA